MSVDFLKPFCIRPCTTRPQKDNRGDECAQTSLQNARAEIERVIHSLETPSIIARRIQPSNRIKNEKQPPCT